MEELLLYIAKGLVDRPDQVEIRAQDSAGGRLLEIRVAPEDVGKVIGREGRTINAVRTLVVATASKKGLKVRVEMAPGQSRPAPEAREATGPRSEPSSEETENGA